MLILILISSLIYAGEAISVADYRGTHYSKLDDIEVKINIEQIFKSIESKSNKLEKVLTETKELNLYISGLKSIAVLNSYRIKNAESRKKSLESELMESKVYHCIFNEYSYKKTLKALKIISPKEISESIANSSRSASILEITSRGYINAGNNLIDWSSESEMYSKCEKLIKEVRDEYYL